MKPAPASPKIQSIILLVITTILTFLIDQLPGIVMDVLPRSDVIIKAYVWIWFPYGFILSHAILGAFVVHWARRIYPTRREQLWLIVLGVATVLLIAVMPYILLFFRDIPESPYDDSLSRVQFFLIYLGFKLPAMIIAGAVYWHIDRRRHQS